MDLVELDGTSDVMHIVDQSSFQDRQVSRSLQHLRPNQPAAYTALPDPLPSCHLGASILDMSHAPHRGMADGNKPVLLGYAPVHLSASE